jgi:hypothetical protein
MPGIIALVREHIDRLLSINIVLLTQHRLN